MRQALTMFLLAGFLFALHTPYASAAPVVSGVSGTVSHGSAIAVSGSGFGTKSNASQSVQAAPLIWDFTAEQYVGGVNQNAYSGFPDGQLINTKVWGASQNVAYSTGRAHRDSSVTAHYAGWGQNGNPTKMHLTPPTPPSTQKRFYLSFYRKDKINPDDATGNWSSKFIRIDDPHNDLVGIDFAGRGGVAHTNSVTQRTGWISSGDETVWTRWEIYVDATKQWFDVWKDGHYHLGSYSGANGTVEMRPAADWRFRTPALSGWQFDCPQLPANQPIMPALFGYDQGGNGSSPGQEVDLSEIYYDNTEARVEISDQATWSDAPTATAHREAQGWLTSWSDTQIQLVLFQGGFSSLTGKYLYVIDVDGHVNANGYLLSGGPPLPSVTIAATDANAAEAGTDPGTFTITRTGDTTSALAISYTVSGTATNGVDYTPTLSSTATIPAGASTVDVTVTPVNDTAVEDSETVILTISTNANYMVGTPASATVTITDNDQPPAFKSGDCNKDYKIDGIDLAVLCADWDPLGVAPSHTWAQGDFNGDGKIDGIDLALLCQNWNPLGYSGDASQANVTTLSAPANASPSKAEGRVRVTPSPARRLVPWPTKAP